MPRTVGPREKWIHYGVFFLGVFMVFGGIVAGFGALQYEFALDSTTENPEVGGRPVYEYGNLPPQEQRVVDGAIDGKRYAFESNTPIPGVGQSGLRPKQVVVRKGDATYVFTHEIGFAETEPAGAAAVALVLVGFVAVAEAIRRHHYPRSLPWQTG
ncbi:ABC transporter ATP-binding protein [Halomicrococcus sp. SG-WS-1]|uniref:ABC transporter ATP-binding protein n=1 Tax=Halomicrococcus sp. SG-WS-1 TaxID=3439057 RepID=UPI003F79E9C8